jgi:hypothetical protein
MFRILFVIGFGSGLGLFGSHHGHVRKKLTKVLKTRKRDRRNDKEQNKMKKSKEKMKKSMCTGRRSQSSLTWKKDMCHKNFLLKGTNKRWKHFLPNFSESYEKMFVIFS